MDKDDAITAETKATAFHSFTRHLISFFYVSLADHTTFEMFETGPVCTGTQDWIK